MLVLDNFSYMSCLFTIILLNNLRAWQVKLYYPALHAHLHCVGQQTNASCSL